MGGSRKAFGLRVECPSVLVKKFNSHELIAYLLSVFCLVFPWTAISTNIDARLCTGSQEVHQTIRVVSFPLGESRMFPHCFGKVPADRYVFYRSE